MKARCWLLCAALALVPGCRETQKFAPVSGVVTLNGKPLANATVAFSPIAQPGSIDAGDGSVGKTNAQGEYTLTTSRGVAGAMVGKHRVRISALAPQVGESDARPPRSGWPLMDKIPARYNGETTLTFDVVPGANKADFSLTSP
jgi:hypothetical protein